MYRWAPHFGEEPPLVGRGGSGTVFFGRCTLRCLYCQNYPWSQLGAGRPCGVEELAEALRALRRAGCHNWNLVSPTPWLPQIQAALELARRDGAALPVVYNTSGYERVETLRRYAGLADIYLPDLRYARPETARAASGAADYVETARAAVREMWRQAGPLRRAADGTARGGTICRLLILPGHAQETVANLRWLAEHIGPQIAVSVMAQYVPAHAAADGPAPWNRRLRPEEYDAVREALETLGFADGWLQELGDAPAELLGFRMRPDGTEGT